MIILHFDLQPQFKYINYFIYPSHHFTPHGRCELNKLASLPMCGFIAQLVEHRTAIAEVMVSNPVEALIFFRLLLSNCLNWKIYCDDHSSLWYSISIGKWASQILMISLTSHVKWIHDVMSQTSIIEIWFYLLTSSLNGSHNMVLQTFQLTVAIITTTITIIVMGICSVISTKLHFIHCFQIEFPRIQIWNSWFFTFEIIWLQSHEMWCIFTGVPDQHQV